MADLFRPPADGEAEADPAAAAGAGAHAGAARRSRAADRSAIAGRTGNRRRRHPASRAAAPGQTLTREAALAGSPRVRIETPSLAGSIALKGGRIDDLSLIKYRETVDPKSPPIVLLAPSGSPHPFYAEFGWSPPSGTRAEAAGPGHRVAAAGVRRAVASAGR